MSEHNLEDPCAEFGPTQKWALVWLIVTLVGASALTYKLSRIDRHLIDSGGVDLNNEASRENRAAASSIASESVDSRQRANLASVEEQISK